MSVCIRSCFLLLFSLYTTACTFGQSVKTSGVLRVYADTQGNTGYKDQKGKVVIAAGKYPMCFTQTFHQYAIVTKPGEGLVAIDRNEQVLYQVFLYDNGPDEPAERLFRIMKDHKIGYADSKTGRVVISPQFECAAPFKRGTAKVSMHCQTRTDGEHKTWESDQWFLIDKRGKPLRQAL